MEYLILPWNNKLITAKDFKKLYPRWKQKITRSWGVLGSIIRADLTLSTIHININIIPEKETWLHLLRLGKHDPQFFNVNVTNIMSSIDFAILIRTNSEIEDHIQPLVSFWEGYTITSNS